MEAIGEILLGFTIQYVAWQFCCMIMTNELRIYFMDTLMKAALYRKFDLKLSADGI